jgi:hypothetical protein
MATEDTTTIRILKDQLRRGNNLAGRAVGLQIGTRKAIRKLAQWEIYELGLEVLEKAVQKGKPAHV